MGCSCQLIQQALPQGADALLQATVDAGHGQLGGPAASGRDHLADRLGPGEIQPAVEEGPLAEFPRQGPAGPGRQHQLRAHMAHIGTPIMGDEKYGGLDDMPEGMDRKLHLHARRIIFPHPREGTIDITAPLPDHMLKSFELFDFDANRFEEGEG